MNMFHHTETFILACVVIVLSIWSVLVGVALYNDKKEMQLQAVSLAYMAKEVSELHTMIWSGRGCPEIQEP